MKTTGSIRIGDIKTSFVINEKCPLCMSKGPKGNSRRNRIDAIYLKHDKISDITDEINYKYKLSVSPLQVKKHRDEHSPHLGKLKAKQIEVVTKSTETLLENVAKQYVDPDVAVEGLINIGWQKVLNGEIEIDGKIFMQALSEQNRRKSSGTIRQILENVDKHRFNKAIEGEVVGDE